MRDFDSDLKSYLRESANKREFQIRDSADNRPAIWQSLTLDLATARASSNPLKISFPFVSLFVREASDTTANVSLAPAGNGVDRIDSAMNFRKNDQFTFDEWVNGGYLYWTAQTGKTMTIVFSTRGRMIAGSQISQISGGISISDGSSVSSAKMSSTGAAASVTVTTAATQLCAADTDRKALTMYFPADCWIGDASVAVGTRGIYQPAGQFIYKNTAALYAIAVSGSVVVTGNQEN